MNNVTPDALEWKILSRLEEIGHGILPGSIWDGPISDAAMTGCRWDFPGGAVIVGRADITAAWHGTVRRQDSKLHRRCF